MDKHIEYWIPKSEKEQWKEWHDRVWGAMIFGRIQEREPKEDDNVKLAWVIIDKKRTMVGLDTVTKYAYRLRDDRPTWKRPLERIEYDSFERWCTTFDV